MLYDFVKWLNFFGIRCKYLKDLDDDEILNLLRKEDILLTADKDLYKRASKKCKAIFIERKNKKDELVKVLKLFNYDIKGMHCMICGNKLKELKKHEIVEHNIPEKVWKSHKTFFYCDKCKKYYWKGSHWKNIKTFYTELAKRLEEKPLNTSNQLFAMIREDPFGRKVIISPKRKEKPSEYRGEIKQCPFCKGVIEKEKREIWRDYDDWKTMIIKNKYPINPYSYVIIHDKHNANLDDEELLIGWGKAIKHMAKKSNNKYMLIFKNQGFLSGASVKHTHEQIVFIDEIFFNEKKVKKFLDNEIKSSRYINGILAPYVSIRPYELWVVFNSSDISEFDEKEMLKLKDAYLFIKEKLGDFDYNVIIIYSPNKLFPIFAILLPRKEVFSGIEYLTRVSVNGVPPEEVANMLKDYLKRVKDVHV